MMRDLIGYGARPPKVEWPGGAQLAVSIVINYEEGAEATSPESFVHENTADLSSPVPDGVRDLNIESTFEYGSRVGVWRLLDILDRESVRATFYLCGLAAERNPAVARAIVERGHEPCGHQYRFVGYHTLSIEEQRRDIEACVRSIAETTGQRPVGFNTKWGPTAETRGLVADAGGFLYDSMAFNDDTPYYARIGPQGRPWLVVPYTLELNDARYWRGSLASVGDLEFAVREAFDRLYEEGSDCSRMMTVGFHARISGTPSRAGVLQRFLRYAKARNVWIARRDEIAQWWLAHSPAEAAGPLELAGDEA